MSKNPEFAIPSSDDLPPRVAYSLLELYKNLLRFEVKVNTFKVDRAKLQKEAEEVTKANQWPMDGKFYCPTLDSFKRIITIGDFTDKVKYLKEKRDCDNIAIIFHANMTAVFEINAIADVTGKVYNQEGELLSWHVWNAVYTDKGIYYYEPQNDNLKKVEAPIVEMGDWKYEGKICQWY